MLDLRAHFSRFLDSPNRGGCPSRGAIRTTNWPDVTREAQIKAWTTRPGSPTGKWGHVMGPVWREGADPCGAHAVAA